MGEDKTAKKAAFDVFCKSFGNDAEGDDFMDFRSFMYLLLFLCGDNKAATFNNLFEFYNVCDEGIGCVHKEKKFSKEEFKAFVGKVFDALVVYSYTMGAWPNTELDEEKCDAC